jgi:hypothetical protein
VRENGRIVGGEGWQGKVYKWEEWKKLLRMARNRRILHMPMEWNEWMCAMYHEVPIWSVCKWQIISLRVFLTIYTYHITVASLFTSLQSCAAQRRFGRRTAYRTVVPQDCNIIIL